MSRTQFYLKCKTFVLARFAGSWSDCFAYYAPGGRLDMAALVRFLHDAGIGNDWSRSLVGKAVMQALDANGDNAIDEAEFRAAVERGK